MTRNKATPDERPTSSGPTAAALLPGMALSAAIASAAFVFQRLSGLSVVSPLVLSLLLGIAVRRFMGPGIATGPGVSFTVKRVLRLGIILLGLQITVAQVLDLGVASLLVVAITLLGSFFAIRLFGRLIGVEPPLTDLIAVGTSVCGASAIVATNAITRAPEEDVAYALASVTLLGTLAMLIYPFLAPLLNLDAAAFGLWAGASIHEVAQVAGAGFQHSEMAGHYATVSKLTRVALLAPLILLMVLLTVTPGKAANAEATPKPWFVAGFIALVGINSVVDIPAPVTFGTGMAASFMLSAALAAMGLQTDLSALRQKGVKPLILAASGWLFIAVFAFSLVKAFSI